MEKVRIEAENLEALAKKAMPEAKEIFVRKMAFDHKIHAAVSIRGIDVEGGKQYCTNAFKKDGESNWACAKPQTTPAIKDAKKLEKSLKDYSPLADFSIE